MSGRHCPLFVFNDIWDHPLIPKCRLSKAGHASIKVSWPAAGASDLFPGAEVEFGSWLGVQRNP